jgi:hypothetical protein
MTQRWLNSDPHVITRSDPRCEFRPTPLGADITFSLFVAVGLGCLGMAGFLGWAGRGSPVGPLFGTLLALVAAVNFWQAVRARRLQHVPLVVESGGRVCYGERELCSAASVQAVQLKCVPGGEHDNYNVSLVLTAGGEVKLPAPYFTGFLHREPARWFAVQVAKALQVDLVERG